MKLVRGFTLIELLVYVLLFGFSSYVMITSSGLLQAWSSWALQNQRIILQQRLLRDVIMRDVTAASRNPAHWSAQGVFRKQFLNERHVPTEYDVAYTCSAGLCLRWQGIFDYQQQRWLRQQRIVLGQVPLKRIGITPTIDKQGAVHHVTLQMLGDNQASTVAATYRVRSVAVPYAG